MFRVLIADDENSVVQSLVCSIPWEELGLEVVRTASDGAAVLEYVEKEEVDIAILDIRMPGVNGLELCSEMRKKNERIQLIIASGYAEFAYTEKAIQYGVIGYCLKPLDYVQVTRFLRRAVHNLRRDGHVADREDLMEILERRVCFGLAWSRSDILWRFPAGSGSRMYSRRPVSQFGSGADSGDIS